MKAVDIETDHTNTIRARKRLLNEQTHERIRKKEAEKEGKPFVPLSDIDLDATISIPSYQDQGFTRKSTSFSNAQKHPGFGQIQVSRRIR